MTSLSSRHITFTFHELAQEITERTDSSDIHYAIERMIAEYDKLDQLYTEVISENSAFQEVIEDTTLKLDTIHHVYDQTTTGFRDFSDLGAVIMQAVA
jgi:hypothetical protein